MTEGKKIQTDFPVSGLDDFGDKTFLGGGRLSTRTVLFFFFSMFTMGALLSGFYIAEKRLSAEQNQMARSKELTALVASVEKSTWRIRINEKNFLLSKKARHSEKHKVDIDMLTKMLNTLHEHPNAAPIREHITTINEGISQYSTEFDNAVSNEGTFYEVSVLGKRLNGAAGELEAMIAKEKKIDLSKHKEKLAAIRQHEKKFVQQAVMQDLVKLNKGIDEFANLLLSSKLPKASKASIDGLLKNYQARLAEFAKSRLKRERQINRLDEIFNYITPSINGLISHAESNLRRASASEQRLRGLYRLSLPASGVAFLLAVTLFGIVMLRSIASPVRDVAGAVKRMVSGEDNVEIPALGNRDEIGDISRSLVKLRTKFAELAWLRETIHEEEGKVGEEAASEMAALRLELDEALEKAKKGEAVMAEAIQLRVDVEAMKAEAGKGSSAEKEAGRLRKELEEAKKELAKGETALIEAALLRIDLESTKAELGKALAETKEAKETAGAASSKGLPVPQDESKQPDETALSGRITEASQHLAQSSQSVSMAAYEAERTGAMIKGLAEASGKIGELDALLANISNQTNFLVPQPDSTVADQGEADSNLVVLTSDYKKAAGHGQEVSEDEAIGQRFDAIRATTNQAAWTLKDVADIVQEVKEVASEIAASSSAEALEITNELLEQSEHLRGMLDSLVSNIQEKTLPEPEAPGKKAK